jgi:hypothetical protein
MHEETDRATSYPRDPPHPRILPIFFKKERVEVREKIFL